MNEQFSTDPTPYQIAKAIGVRPQMMYNYAANKATKIGKAAYRDESNKIRVEKSVANQYAIDYVARKNERSNA
jgi:hypothetical protein